MLRLVAEEADIWNCSAGNYAQLDRKLAALRATLRRDRPGLRHARAVAPGPRGPRPTDAALEAPLADARRRLSFFGDVDAIATIGTPDRCIDTLRKKVAQGITYFVCLFTDGGQPETVRLFGERVLPAFR